jgi:hypothetical protein
VRDAAALEALIAEAGFAEVRTRPLAALGVRMEARR